MTHLIFVFGTLKDGFPNFSENEGTRVGGRFVTQTPYELYLVGPRYVPWMIADQGQGVPIAGEVYSVDDNGLARMDRLERVDEPDGYQRLSISATNTQTNESIETFVYLMRANQLDRSEIQAGPLPEYRVADAARYRPRSG